MVVGTLELDLRLDGCFSLKDKRQILRGLLDRTRHEFGVSIAEVGDAALWNSAIVGVAVVSNDARHALSVLARVTERFEGRPEVVVEAARQELLRP